MSTAPLFSCRPALFLHHTPHTPENTPAIAIDLISTVLAKIRFLKMMISFMSPKLGLLAILGMLALLLGLGTSSPTAKHEQRYMFGEVDGIFRSCSSLTSGFEGPIAIQPGVITFLQSISCDAPTVRAYPCCLQPSGSESTWHLLLFWRLNLHRRAPFVEH